MAQRIGSGCDVPPLPPASTASDRLALRSTLSFVGLPGVVAYLVPLAILRPAVRPQTTGLGIAVVGTVVLIWCVVEFHRRGRGTLAPWDPPVALVVSGLYRYSRNPMYVGVLLVLVGWAVSWPSLSLWIYAVAIASAFHLRVILAEEPWLARTFGASWESYRHAVPRWIGVRRESPASKMS